MGLKEEQSHSSIRIGCGRFNTEEEINITADEILTYIQLLNQIRA